jgi:hypothetical protein
VRVELGSQPGLEVLDGVLHGHDDAQQPGHGGAERGFDLRGLTQCAGFQVAQDLLDHDRVVATPALLQQGHQAAPSESLRILGRRRGRQNGERSFGV